MSARLRIVVDRELCEANAVCQRVAPEVFAVDETDSLRIAIERPGHELEERVSEAIRRCPRGALSLAP